MAPKSTLLQRLTEAVYRALQDQGHVIIEAAGLGAENPVMAAVAKNQDELGHGQLDQDNSKDEKDARGSRKCFRLIDPELNERGGEKEQSNDEILRRLGLLPAENKKGQTSDESAQDHDLDHGRRLQCTEQFVA